MHRMTHPLQWPESLPTPRNRRFVQARRAMQDVVERLISERQQTLDDAGHARLIESYLREAGNWRAIQSLDRSPNPRRSDPLFAVVARRQAR